MGFSNVYWWTQTKTSRRRTDLPKRQSSELHHSRSLTKPKKSKQILRARKVMATVLWDQKSVMLIQYMPTVRLFSDYRRGVLPSGAMLPYDNTRPHSSAASTMNLPRQLKWDVFELPPYSPDLAQSDFHFLPSWKIFGRESLKKWQRTKESVG